MINFVLLSKVCDCAKSSVGFPFLSYLNNPLNIQSAISELAVSFAKIGFNLLGLELIDRFKVELKEKLINKKSNIKNFIRQF